MAPGASTASNFGKGIVIIDAAGNVTSTIRGSKDIMENGLNWSNGAEALGGGAGLSGNVIGRFGKAGSGGGKVSGRTLVGARRIDPDTLPLPNGYSNSKFGDMLKWAKGKGDAWTKFVMAQEQLKGVDSAMIRNLQKEGISPEMLKRWSAFYHAETIRVPANPTAAARAFYLDELLKLMGG